MKKIILIALLALVMNLGMIYGFAYAQEDSDITPPSDVASLQATVTDSGVNLRWDLATDNVKVSGYKVYYGTNSVTNEKGTNYTKAVSVGDVIEYTIKGLTDGTIYYFAVTALDSSGNESEYYSNEASATLAAEEITVVSDSEAPKVASAEALFNTEVTVSFSESIVLPENAKDAFTIQNNDTLEILEITNAVYGETENSVLLTTDTQSEGVSYIVTAGIDIGDKVGNPIISGVADVAVFNGVAAVKPVYEKDTEPPAITGTESVSDTQVKVTFSEMVNLSLDPVENFEIFLESNIDEKLKIIGIKLADDDYTVILTTDKQANVTYSLVVSGVTDKFENVISTENNANKVTFSGKGETTLLDLVAPENVTGFVSSIMNGAIKFSWTASINSENDLVKYILYKSTDKGETYDDGTNVPADATSYMASGLKPGVEYYFKVVAEDEAGNKSSGVVESATLPKTGPGMLLLALASLGAGFLTRKVKK